MRAGFVFFDQHDEIKNLPAKYLAKRSAHEAGAIQLKLRG